MQDSCTFLNMYLFCVPFFLIDDPYYDIQYLERHLKELVETSRGRVRRAILWVTKIAPHIWIFDTPI